MKYILFFFSFFYFAPFTSGKNSLLIRYSLDDCASCNMNLESVLKFSAQEKVICYKESYKNDEEIDEINVELSKNNFKIVYSDSLYNSSLFDSSIFSFVVVFNELKEKIFISHLKTLNLTELALFFRDNSIEQKKVILPKEGCSIEYSENYIYCLDDRKKRVLVVNKKNLDQIEDTVKLSNSLILKDCYLKQFGDTQQYQIILNEKKNNPLLPLSIEILTAKCQDDHLYLLCSNKYIVEENNIQGVHSFNSILVFKGAKFIKSIPFDINNIICDTIFKDCYTSFSASFLLYDNVFYSTVRKKMKTLKNALVAKVNFTKENKPILAELMPFNMPTEHANGAFYNLLDLIQCNEFFMIHYSPTLFDLNNKKEINIPIYMAPNFNSREDIMLGKVKINSEIKSFFIKNQDMSVIYRSNDTLKSATVMIKKNNLILMDEKLISCDYDQDEMDFFQTTSNGFYFYSKRNHRFIFNKNID